MQSLLQIGPTQICTKNRKVEILTLTLMLTLLTLLTNINNVHWILTLTLINIQSVWPALRNKVCYWIAQRLPKGKSGSLTVDHPQFQTPFAITMHNTLQCSIPFE